MLSSSYVYFIALEVWFQYKGNIFNLWFSCIASFHYIKDLLSVTKIIYLQDISIKNGNNSITQIMYTNLLNRNSFKICNFVFMLKSQFYASHSTLLDEENLNLRKKEKYCFEKGVWCISITNCKLLWFFSKVSICQTSSAENPPKITAFDLNSTQLNYQKKF